MLSNLDTYLEALRTSPLEFLLTLVYAVAVILISLILHECAHGYVAYRCGDPTAKMMGRLSLNPKAHLDLIGTLSMFLIGVGWAKPVPVNPRNFRHGRRDDFFVSIAGIATNLCLCLICMFLSVVVGKIMFGSEMLGEFSSSSLPHLFSPFYQFTDGRDNVILSITNGIFAESALADFAVPWLRYVERFLLMSRILTIFPGKSLTRPGWWCLTIRITPPAPSPRRRCSPARCSLLVVTRCRSSMILPMRPSAARPAMRR